MSEQQERPSHGRRGEPGLRGLVGSGPSRVGIDGAMRARDVARPRPEDLEAAERTVVLRMRPAPRPGPQGSGGASPDRS